MFALSRYSQNLLIDNWRARPNLVVRLYTTAPAADGTGGTEVTGGGYAPAAVTLSAGVAVANGTRTENTATVNFPQATGDWSGGVAVTGWAVWDTTAGQPLFGGSLDFSRVVRSGDLFRPTAGQLSFTLLDA